MNKFRGKMEPEIKKVNSLLKFYYKEGVEVSLKGRIINNIIIKGIIIRKNLIGKKYIILKGKDKKPMKIFMEDIEFSSIIPVDYEKGEVRAKSNALSPALRYKILKRDRNTCQSCGARAPEVELEVDHKIPVSKGGKDDESNLVTKCKDCNRGKSDKE